MITPSRNWFPSVDERVGIRTQHGLAELLRKVPLFAGLSEHEVSDLAARLARQEHPPGYVICRQGDPGDCCYIVETGEVEVRLRSSPEGELAVAALGVGAFFGEMALLDGEPRSADVVALTSVSLLALEREDFVAFLQDHRQALQNLLLLLTTRLRATDHLFESNDAARAHEVQMADARAHVLAGLNQLKDDLLDSVSHEVRTPLNAIQVYSELLLTYEDPTVRREFLEIIASETQRLSRLLENMLDLRKIESGSLPWNMELVDVGVLAEDAARIYGPLVAQEHLTFTVSVDSALPASFR